MPSLLAYTAPLALILPLFGQAQAPAAPNQTGDQAGNVHEPAPHSPAPDYEQPQEGSRATPFPPAFPEAPVAATPLDAFHGGQVWRQFRLEQRVIIRISPQRQTNRNSLLARLPQRGLNTRFEEREMDRCLPVNRISGVQTGNGNRLLLFLNDNRIVSLNLERACRAREFYSGFYVERSEDGNLCINRDELQSRSGARCEIERMRQLVAVND